MSIAVVTWLELELKLELELELELEVVVKVGVDSFFPGCRRDGRFRGAQSLESIKDVDRH